MNNHRAEIVVKPQREMGNSELVDNAPGLFGAGIGRRSACYAIDVVGS